MSTSRSPRARSERRLTDEPAYEELERELETIVTRLEQGQVSLDEAIALWERGEELYRFCLGKLDAAHGRIEELAQAATQQAAEGQRT